MFLLCIDDYGAPLQRPDFIKRTLGIALIAELLLTKHAAIDARSQALILRPEDDAPRDSIAQRLVHLVRAERLHVRDWIDFLTKKDLVDDNVYDLVGGRLARDSFVTPQRSGLRRRIRYVPVNGNVSAAGWVRISTDLKRGEKLTGGDAVLGGLLLANGLYRSVLTGSDRAAKLRESIGEATPDIRALIHHAEEAMKRAAVPGF